MQQSFAHPEMPDQVACEWDLQSWQHADEKYDPKTLKTALRERGLHSTKSTGGRYYWQGLGLKDSSPKNGLFGWSESEESGPSGPSGPKSNIFSRRENTSQKTWNSRPLTSTTSTSELEFESESGGTSTQEIELPFCGGCLDRGVETPAMFEFDEIMYCKECYEEVRRV
jgi:hypothetical protein